MWGRGGDTSLSRKLACRAVIGAGMSGRAAGGMECVEVFGHQNASGASEYVSNGVCDDEYGELEGGKLCPAVYTICVPLISPRFNESTMDPSIRGVGCQAHNQ